LPGPGLGLLCSDRHTNLKLRDINHDTAYYDTVYYGINLDDLILDDLIPLHTHSKHLDSNQLYYHETTSHAKRMSMHEELDLPEGRASRSGGFAGRCDCTVHDR
jgi:hypothetical protein